MIVRQKRIYREDLQANPDVLYVFGDNLERKGYGGQAAEMRDEPNAVGVATKKAPGIKDEDFFNDDEFDDNVSNIALDFTAALQKHRAGGVVVVPLDGIGTGFSDLPARAPRTYLFVCALGLGPVQEEEEK